MHDAQSLIEQAEVDAEEGSRATEESLAAYVQRSAIRHEMWLSTLQRM
jgi:hypothetical protein